MPGTPQEYRPAYRRAIEEVDRQFDARARAAATRKACSTTRSSCCFPTTARRSALNGLDAARDRARPRNLGFALGPWHERHEPAPVPGAARDARLWARPPAGSRPGLRLAGVARGPAADARGARDRHGAQRTWTASRWLPYLADPVARRRLRRASVSPRRISTRRNMLAGRYEPSGVIDEAADVLRAGPRVRLGPVPARSACPSSWLRSSARRSSPSALLAAIPGWTDGQGPRYLLYGPPHAPAQGPGGPPGPWPPSPRRGGSGTPYSAVSGRAAGCRRTCPECEPGQGLVGRSMGAFPLI